MVAPSTRERERQRPGKTHAKAKIDTRKTTQPAQSNAFSVAAQIHRRGNEGKQKSSCLPGPPLIGHVPEAPVSCRDRHASPRQIYQETQRWLPSGQPALGGGKGGRRACAPMRERERRGPPISNAGLGTESVPLCLTITLRVRCKRDFSMWVPGVGWSKAFFVVGASQDRVVRIHDY